MALESPPSLDAAELYTLALRLVAIGGLYRGSDLRWAASSLRQSTTDPADAQVVADIAAHLERMADVDDAFVRQHYPDGVRR